MVSLTESQRRIDSAFRERRSQLKKSLIPTIQDFIRSDNSFSTWDPRQRKVFIEITAEQIAVLKLGRTVSEQIMIVRKVLGSDFIVDRLASDWKDRIREEGFKKPRSVYALSKSIAERFVENHRLL